MLTKQGFKSPVVMGFDFQWVLSKHLEVKEWINGTIFDEDLVKDTSGVVSLF